MDSLPGLIVSSRFEQGAHFRLALHLASAQLFRRKDVVAARICFRLSRYIKINLLHVLLPIHPVRFYCEGSPRDAQGSVRSVDFLLRVHRSVLFVASPTRRFCVYLTIDFLFGHVLPSIWQLVYVRQGIDVHGGFRCVVSGTSSCDWMKCTIWIGGLGMGHTRHPLDPSHVCPKHMGIAPFSIRHGSSFGPGVLCGMGPPGSDGPSIDPSPSSSIEWSGRRKGNRTRMWNREERQGKLRRTQTILGSLGRRMERSSFPNPTTILRHRSNNNGAATRTN